jgi:hypothetical protein
MASRKRAMLQPTDDWEQLQFQLDLPEQARYELIRPVVVFGAPRVEACPATELRPGDRPTQGRGPRLPPQ